MKKKFSTVFCPVAVIVSVLKLNSSLASFNVTVSPLGLWHITHDLVTVFSSDLSELVFLVLNVYCFIWDVHVTHLLWI